MIRQLLKQLAQHSDIRYSTERNPDGVLARVIVDTGHAISDDEFTRLQGIVEGSPLTKTPEGHPILFPGYDDSPLPEWNARYNPPGEIHPRGIQFCIVQAEKPNDIGVYSGTQSPTEVPQLEAELGKSESDRVISPL